MRHIIQRLHNTVNLVDSFEWLKTLPSCCIDSCVTDCPYEINFMGAKWDNTGISFNYKFWYQVFRVLKPGGYLLSFAGARTYHRIACAIEDAGFKLQSPVYWCFGEGMPKGLDIGKAFDKAAKVKRDVVSMRTVDDIRGGNFNGSDGKTMEYEITTPKPDEVKEWEGWKYGLQSLKPAVEPICFAQKPITEKRIIDNIRKWGVGAINCEACRILTTGKDKEAHERSWDKPQVEQKGMIKGLGNIPLEKYKPTSGRLPSNLILQHSPDCVCLGTKKVKANKGQRGSEKNKGTNQAKGWGMKNTGEEVGYYDEDGMETVESWECSPDCPVNLINQQSCKTKGTGRRCVKKRNSMGYHGGTTCYDDFSYDDGGGASRYFLNLSPDPIIYNPKVSTKEKKRGGKHPTTKPLKLIRYLVRLITQKGGLVLDPFVGGGTTAIAALAEGCKFVVADKVEAHVEATKKRVGKIKTNPRKTVIKVKKKKGNLRKKLTDRNNKA